MTRTQPKSPDTWRDKEYTINLHFYRILAVVNACRLAAACSYVWKQNFCIVSRENWQNTQPKSHIYHPESERERTYPHKGACDIREERESKQRIIVFTDNMQSESCHGSFRRYNYRYFSYGIIQIVSASV